MILLKQELSKKLDYGKKNSCDFQVLGREHWIIQGEKYKFCSRRCAENRAKMTAKKWKLVHVRWKSIIKQEMYLQLLFQKEKPMAIAKFRECCNELSDYAYWFMLSTLWVSYSGFSDLELCKELFSRNRPNKSISLMKPDELAALKNCLIKLLFIVRTVKKKLIGARIHWIKILRSFCACI